MSLRTHRPRGGPNGYIERVVYQIIVILGLSVLLAGANMLVNPLSPRYGAGELRKGEIHISDIPTDTSIIWVDARNQVDYDEAHIKGALLINDSLYYVQIANFLQVYKGSQTVLVYCTTEGCDTAHWVADRIHNETGAKDVRVIFGGWDELSKSSLPKEGRDIK